MTWNDTTGIVGVSQDLSYFLSQRLVSQKKQDQRWACSITVKTLFHKTHQPQKLQPQFSRTVKDCVSI